MTRTRPPSTRRVKTSKLRSGRPPLLSSNHDNATTSSGGAGPRQNQSQSHSQSSRHTRSIIRAHHVLQKQLARAKAADDQAQIGALERQLAEAGGLKTYQLASTVGQSASRGGDSSRVLVEWLRDEIEPRRRSLKAKPDRHAPRRPPIHILEVGALSTQNALNIPEVTCVRRIDLRSTAAGIEECDFMAFPPPSAPDGSGEWRGRRGYDVLSVSLVLNYVPDAKGRGDMLRRTTEFLAPSLSGSADADEQGEAAVVGRPLLPSLFLVLPAPCLHNSRYLTPEHLETIMSSLGYSLTNQKTTQKLYYSLWHYDATKREEWRNQGQPTRFPKREINSGGGRNNFCIVVDHT